MPEGGYLWAEGIDGASGISRSPAQPPANHARAPDEPRFSLLALTGVALSVAVGVLAFSLAIAERGFSLTDEAYYLLSAIHPDAVNAFVTGQHWFSGAIWKLTGSTTAFRSAGILLTLGGSTLLALGIGRAIQSRTATTLERNVALVSAAWIGAALYTSVIQPSPSYNLLGAAFGYGAVGLLLLGLTASSAKVRIPLCGIAGACCVLVVATKPMAGAALTVLCIALSLVPAELFSGRRIARTASLLVGAFVSATALALSNGGPAAILGQLADGQSLFALVQSRGVQDRLVAAVQDLDLLLLEVISGYWLPILLGAFARWGRQNFLAYAATVTMLLVSLRQAVHLGGFQDWRQQAVFLLALMILVVLLTPSTGRNIDRVVLISIGALPVVLCLGTGNAIGTQLLTAAAPWTALAVALVFRATLHIRGAAALSATILLVFSGSQIITANARDPYDLAAPIQDQTELVRIPPIGTVRVDRQTEGFLRQAMQLKERCNIPDSAPFLGLYNNPGLALALNVVPPTTPWIANSAQAQWLIDSGHVHPERAIIGVNKGWPGMPRPALPAGIALGRTHTLCGRLTFPHAAQRMDVWVPAVITKSADPTIAG